MNIIAKTRKSMMVIGLSLTVLLSSSAFLIPNSAHAAAVSVTSSKANKIITTGKQLMGVRYRLGAPAGRTDVFDCSSFVQYVFKQNGIALPRSSRQQSQIGTFVSRNQLQPGDLIFFYTPIHHVAIYIGNGKILHTYGSPGVTISDLNSGWWDTHYKTARRVLTDIVEPVVTTKPPKIQPATPSPSTTPRTPSPSATPRTPSPSATPRTPSPSATPSPIVISPTITPAPNQTIPTSDNYQNVFDTIFLPLWS